jgi:2'-5' RNA ligase
LTDEVRGGLRAELAGQEFPGRVVPPENWHLTLIFLGDTSPDTLERLKLELRSEDLGKRTVITFAGLGAFPRAARASVVWLGVTEGSEAICEVHAGVQAAVRRAGIPAEGRAFVPHLTLSRVHPPRDVRRLIRRPLVFDRWPMPVNSVVLFRSTLGNGPARYEELARFDLTSTRLDSRRRNAPPHRPT